VVSGGWNCSSGRAISERGRTGQCSTRLNWVCWVTEHKDNCWREEGQSSSQHHYSSVAKVDRTMDNQRELGVLSHITLRWLLEGGGPEQQPVPLLFCS
jgi:hypothetical protein